MSFLVIKQLKKYFGEQKAVNKVSFQLEKGEILAILGESGSGKTTLLQLIAGYQEPDSGSLLLDNQPITPPSQKLIAGHPDIKLVKQDYGLFPNMSLKENIAYELRFYEASYRQARVNHLLKLSGLWHLQNHLPKQVSGGEQQRAVIVRSIAEKPKLLLLDEPFSHLDARNKRKLKEEILQIIHGEGVSCIFVSHDAADAFGIADKIAVMQKGKFIQMDSPENLYRKPQNRYVAEMTGEVALKKIEKNKVLLKNIDLETLRPHQIIEQPESDLRAIIRKITFIGTFFEVEIEVENILLKMIKFEKPTIGNTIRIEIKQESK
jgi:ABC-type Fe3+/spermidine/putrescine transport system ATPase subunit